MVLLQIKPKNKQTIKTWLLSTVVSISIVKPWKPHYPWLCYTNHSVTMAFVIKLWLYKWQSIRQTMVTLLFKTMVNVRKGSSQI